MSTPAASELRIVTSSFAAGATSLASLPPPVGIEVAFAGRSNVGKSTLMNGLCVRKNLVKTSNTPGCTRQLSFFDTVCQDRAAVTLVDLPGYGYAKRSKSERSQWAELIDGYLLGRPTLALVVCLIDIRRGLEEDDASLWELVQSPPTVARHPVKLLTVATKLDKLPTNQRKLAVQKLKPQVGTELQGVGSGLPETYEKVWRRIRSLCGIGDATPINAAEKNQA